MEQQGKLIDARRAYELMRGRGLPEAGWATEQLRRLGAVPSEESTPVVDE
jgi:hypothetical protein